MTERVCVLDVDAWFQMLDRFEESFMPEGREQPEAPVRQRSSRRRRRSADWAIRLRRAENLHAGARHS